MSFFFLIYDALQEYNQLSCLGSGKEIPKGNGIFAGVPKSSIDKFQ